MLRRAGALGLKHRVVTYKLPWFWCCRYLWYLQISHGLLIKIQYPLSVGKTTVQCGDYKDVQGTKRLCVVMVYTSVFLKERR